MTKTLTEKQQTFLNVLFDQAAGDVVQAGIDLSLGAHDVVSQRGVKVSADNLPNRKRLLHSAGALKQL